MRAKHLLWAPLLACAVAVPAFAQAPPGLTSYPACTTKPTPQDSEAAHNAFLLGKRFFDEADYGSAVHNFVDAYKLDCTKTELLVTIARANELAGNKPDAVHALETYLDRASSVSPDDRAQIQKRIENLRAQIAASTPSAPPTVAPLPPPTVVAPPPTAAPPPSPPVEEPHHTVGPWIMTGVGGAAAIAGVVLVVVGNSQYQSALSACPMNMCPGGQQGEISSGNDALNLEHVGIGMLIGGGAIAAAGLIWHFAERPKPTIVPTATERSSEKAASLEPFLGLGYAGLAGRF